MRKYADEHHPGWRVAAVSVRIGKVGENPDEMLVVKPVDDRPPPAQAELGGEELRPEKLGNPAGSGKRKS